MILSNVFQILHSYSYDWRTANKAKIISKKGLESGDI